MKEDEKNKISRITDLIDERILKSRIIFLDDAVCSESSRDIIKKMWYLNLESKKDPVLFVINSPGGSVTDGLAIWDQIKLMSPKVITLVTGLAASMGSVLSLVAPKGSRFATKMSRIMIHQPRICGTITGQAVDLEIQAKEIKKTKNVLIDLYVEATGKNREIIEKDIDRDYWMTSQEALEYGLIDKVIDDISELKMFFSK